jgi:type VI secretion system protein ImpF
MAELSLKERLQPSLLDRLSDDEPDKQQESRDRRVLSVQRLRECVLRDLSWLLNAGNLAAGVDLAAYPQTANSVLNYGMPDLSGRTASGIDKAGLERMIRQAILDFEPRILRASLSVRLSAHDSRMDHKALTLLIEGDLWAQPVPVRVYMKTEIDLEIGDARVVHASEAAPR